MDLYTLIKTLHIIAMVAWFAGLFYLPRLFVYHSICAKKPDNVTMLRVMEHKLYYFIMHPAMLMTLVFGVWLIVLNPGWMQQGWLHAKITLVFLLLTYHFSLAYFLRLFKTGAPKTEKFFRLYNEVPTLLLIMIITLVEWQPF